VSCFCEFYLGTCLKNEEKALKNLSQGKKNFSQVNKNISQSKGKPQSEYLFEFL
jgi:hypothetical protein